MRLYPDDCLPLIRLYRLWAVIDTVGVLLIALLGCWLAPWRSVGEPWLILLATAGAAIAVPACYCWREWYRYRAVFRSMQPRTLWPSW